MTCPAGCAADAGPRLRHWALLYGSEEEFLAGAVPIMRDGLEDGGGVLAITGPARGRVLSAELGPWNDRVVVEDTSDWPRRLSGVTERLDQLVRGRAAAADASHLTLLMEPYGVQRWPSLADEWLSLDALANDAWSDLDVHALCPYDRAAHAPDVVEGVRRAHPWLIEHGVRRESSGFQPPADFLGAVQRGPAFPPPTDLLGEVRFVDDLVLVRDLVRAHGSAEGLSGCTLEDLVVAVNEIATNAYLHGAGAGRARVWLQDRAFLVEIADSGPGLAEPVVGHRLPPVGSVGGRGLWLARQLCDALRIRSGADGTTVRLHTHL